MLMKRNNPLQTDENYCVYMLCPVPLTLNQFPLN